MKLTGLEKAEKLFYFPVSKMWTQSRWNVKQKDDQWAIPITMNDPSFFKEQTNQMPHTQKNTLKTTSATFIVSLYISSIVLFKLFKNLSASLSDFNS